MARDFEAQTQTRPNQNDLIIWKPYPVGDVQHMNAQWGNLQHNVRFNMSSKVSLIQFLASVSFEMSSTKKWLLFLSHTWNRKTEFGASTRWQKHVSSNGIEYLIMPSDKSSLFFSKQMWAFAPASDAENRNEMQT